MFKPSTVQQTGPVHPLRATTPLRHRPEPQDASPAPRRACDFSANARQHLRLRREDGQDLATDISPLPKARIWPRVGAL